MNCQRYIGLVRVSTDKQGESGLGLEAGVADLERFIAAHGGTLVTVLEEVDSGCHDRLEDRPVLVKALTLCKRHRACLLVPRVDRLTRSVEVATDIKRSKVAVRFADNPNATEVIIDIYVALSADTGRKISETTTRALARYKEGRRVSKRQMAVLEAKYGDSIPQEAIDAVAGKLGAALIGSRLTDADRAKGRAKGCAKIAREAMEAYADLIPDIQAMRAEGATLEAIADALNARGERTRGTTARPGGLWSKVQVSRVLNRVQAGV
jgi:DNA invertase Pin-like site-specific DNA recombinase